MTDNGLPTELLEKLVRTQVLRQKIASESMRYFFGIYLNHYIQYDLAPFHNDFFALAEDDQEKLIVINAFRGSGKSTYFSTCYPIWAVTGKLQKKFVVIFTQTQSQAKKLLENIKKELEGNEILKADVGPFEDSNEQWSSMSIVLKNHDARIMVASVEQGVRGIRYMQYRPDLIILDDVQDLSSTKTQELRDKLSEWYTSEVSPLGTPWTKIVIIGTRLHDDDFYSRIIRRILDKKVPGIYRRYPIADSRGKSTWQGKYPNKKALRAEKARVGDEVTWQREYMLRIIYDQDYIFTPKDFIHYEVLPSRDRSRFILVAIDLAISTLSTADKTAIVAAVVSGYGKELKAYMLPLFVNKRMGFTETIEEIKRFFVRLDTNLPIHLLVEDVSYQHAAIEQLESEGFPVYCVSPHGEDKRARLNSVSPLVKKGTILFPNHGLGEMERQLIDFGTERYNDLADAFAYLASKVREEKFTIEPNITLI
ncbi:MAG: hypothetical protein M1366_00930 [Patescibacteria group bacterium]|nr:hypothetical protein [Patescibacteria group bacterium]